MSSTKFLEMTALPPTYFNGQTYRPFIKGIKEHEAHSRLALNNKPTDFSHAQSAPVVHQSRTVGHTIGWDRNTMLSNTRYKRQLDLTEYAAVQMRQPLLNVQTVPLNAVNSAIS